MLPPRVGLVDIGNSNLKGAIPLLSNNAANSVSPKVDYLANPSMLGTVANLHWLPSTDTPKPPPKEWMSKPDLWVVPTEIHAFKKLVERLREAQKIEQNETIEWKVSSVQPTALSTFRESLASFFPNDRLHVIDRSQIPMQIDVESPDRVGIDRLLASWGAWTRYGKDNDQDMPLIVIQAGTAVTIDLVDGRGVFCGGAIMPGLTMSLKYMAIGTANLPWLAPPDQPGKMLLPGRSTQAAVLAGASASFVGGIQYLISKYRSQCDSSNVPVIVSGGDKLSLSECLTPPYHVMDQLVLAALGNLAGR